MTAVPPRWEPNGGPGGGPGALARPAGSVLGPSAATAPAAAAAAPASAPAQPPGMYSPAAPPAGHVLGAPARPDSLAGDRAVRQRRAAHTPAAAEAAARAAETSRGGWAAAGGYRRSHRPSIGAALRALRQALPGDPPPGAVRRRARAIGIGRLLTWELAGASLIASIGRPRSVTVAVIAAVACAVAATTVRIRGRLLYEWLGRAGRYALRRRQSERAPGARSPAEDLVDHLIDHPSVETIDLDGIPVAFIHQADGIATVLELQIPDELGDAAWAARTSLASLLPAPDPSTPPFAAKLILQITPSPSPGVRPRAASRRVWLTVQVLRTADIHADDDLSLALANAVQRMIRRLAREDVPTRTFDRDETLSLVSALSHLDSVPDTEPLRFGETWASWQAGAAMHAGFLVRRWSEADEATRLQILRRLHLIPSRGTTIAIAARRRVGNGTTGDNGDSGHLVVRVTESDRGRLENSASLLAFAFKDLGADLGLERQDGDQALAVASSLPLNAHAGSR